MTSENKPGDPAELSFIEKARQAQIIESTIETIVTLGFAQLGVDSQVGGNQQRGYLLPFRREIGWQDGPDPEWLEAGRRAIERLLEQGQEAREFRQFSPRVRATAIRGAIDYISPQMVNHP